MGEELRKPDVEEVEGRDAAVIVDDVGKTAALVTARVEGREPTMPKAVSEGVRRGEGVKGRMGELERDLSAGWEEEEWR